MLSRKERLFDFEERERERASERESVCVRESV